MVVSEVPNEILAGEVVQLRVDLGLRARVGSFMVTCKIPWSIRESGARGVLALSIDGFVDSSFLEYEPNNVVMDVCGEKGRRRVWIHRRDNRSCSSLDVVSRNPCLDSRVEENLPSGTWISVVRLEHVAPSDLPLEVRLKGEDGQLKLFSVPVTISTSDAEAPIGQVFLGSVVTEDQVEAKVVLDDNVAIASGSVVESEGISVTSWTVRQENSTRILTLQIKIRTRDTGIRHETVDLPLVSGGRGRILCCFVVRGESR
jgi:hypothetical protein